MRIKYILTDMPLVKQALCIGDLVRYYGESKFKLAESVQKIATNKGLSVKLLNTIRKHTTAGMTIEQFITGLETAASMDVFTFRVNGNDPCEIFNTNEKEVTLEVYMNPLYFTTKGAMTQYLPGWRKPKFGTEDAVKHQALREQDNWLRWFEKELNNYCPRRLWKKEVEEG